VSIAKGVIFKYFHLVFTNHQSLIHQQSVSAVEQNVDILSLCLHPSRHQLSILRSNKIQNGDILVLANPVPPRKCPLKQRVSVHCHLPNRVAFQFLLLLIYVSFCFILLSCAGPSCLKTWPAHRRFLRQIEFAICLSSFALLRTSLLVTLSSQLIFSIYSISTFQRFINHLSEKTSMSAA